MNSDFRQTIAPKSSTFNICSCPISARQIGKEEMKPLHSINLHLLLLHPHYAHRDLFHLYHLHLLGLLFLCRVRSSQ